MGTNITGYDSVDVFIGVDVGKGEHHAVAVDRAGKRLFDKALPNEEKKRSFFSSGSAARIGDI